MSHAGGTPNNKSSGAKNGRRELQPGSPVACVGSQRGAARPPRAAIGARLRSQLMVDAQQQREELRVVPEGMAP